MQPSGTFIRFNFQYIIYIIIEKNAQGNHIYLFLEEAVVQNTTLWNPDFNQTVISFLNTKYSTLLLVHDCVNKREELVNMT